MPFWGDPDSTTRALLASSRERIRLSKLCCVRMRASYDEAIDSIVKSQETIRHNELSMTPELARLIRNNECEVVTKQRLRRLPPRQ